MLTMLNSTMHRMVLMSDGRPELPAVLPVRGVVHETDANVHRNAHWLLEMRARIDIVMEIGHQSSVWRMTHSSNIFTG